MDEDVSGFEFEGCAKAAISSFGRSLMNPTVSVIIASISWGNLSFLLEGSRVAKSWSLA